MSSAPAHKKLRPNKQDTQVYEPKNILVTGGAGFIASHIVLQLVKQFPQYKVRTSALKASSLLDSAN